MYYLAVEQTDTALGYLGAAAKMDPQFLLMIADINEQYGRQPAQDRALKQAEADYRRLVVKDPLNARNRVKLARVVGSTEEIQGSGADAADRVEAESDELYLRQAAADYYVMRYDLHPGR